MNEYKVFLSERGQVVIPVEIRKKFNTREFIVSFSDEKIILFPSNSNTEKKMKLLVSKLKEMNKKYEKFSKEEISVLPEIKAEGA